MTIQLKKAVVIFIFLLTIILILLFQNYSLKGEFYNVLLVSDQEDITVSTLTKKVLNSAKDLNNSTEVTSYFTSVNTTYLQVADDKDFSSKLNEQIDSNDMFIIVGDQYNETLRDISAVNLDKKFVLIENNLDYSSENVYKINFDWENISIKINEYLEDQISILKDNKKLDDEKLRVVFFIEGEIGDSKSSIFKDKINNDDIEIQYIDITANNYQEKVDTLYKQEGISYFVNLNFNGQEEIIKQLVDLQKDNIYTYYKQETEDNIQEQTNNGEEAEEDDTEAKETNTEQTEEVQLIPIRYITVYNDNVTLGEYDDITQGQNVVKNIIVNTFEYDLTNILEQIIMDEDYKKETVISTEEENLDIKAIV